MRRRDILLAGLGLLGSGRAALAQDWPAKPVRAIIPFGAGSATDIIPRIVFEQMTAQLGQPVVVENRAGAGGTIGAAAVAKAEPDGYTILATSSAHTITPAIYPGLTYDPAGDFAAIAAIGTVPNVLIISPAKGFKTLKAFVEAARAKPGTFNFASVGVGTATHLSAERFRVSAGYQAVHIPFKGGAEAITEVIAGRVDYYFCPIATALPFVREGTLLALAVSSPQRAAELPDVPTTLEAGYPDSDYTFWIGAFAPVRTPRPVVERLNREIAAAVVAPSVKERLAKLGVAPMMITPADFDARVKNEVAVYGRFAKAAGLTGN